MNLKYFAFNSIIITIIYSILYYIYWHIYLFNNNIIIDIDSDLNIITDLNVEEIIDNAQDSIIIFSFSRKSYNYIMYHHLFNSIVKNLNIENNSYVLDLDKDKYASYSLNLFYGCTIKIINYIKDEETYIHLNHIYKEYYDNKIKNIESQYFNSIFLDLYNPNNINYYKLLPLDESKIELISKYIDNYQNDLGIDNKINLLTDDDNLNIITVDHHDDYTHHSEETFIIPYVPNKQEEQYQIKIQTIDQIIYYSKYYYTNTKLSKYINESLANIHNFDLSEYRNYKIYYKHNFESLDLSLEKHFIIFKCNFKLYMIKKANNEKIKDHENCFKMIDTIITVYTYSDDSHRYPNLYLTDNEKTSFYYYVNKKVYKHRLEYIELSKDVFTSINSLLEFMKLIKNETENPLKFHKLVSYNKFQDLCKNNLCVIYKGSTNDILIKYFEKNQNVNFEIIWIDETNPNYSRFSTNLAKCNLLFVELNNNMQYCHKTYIKNSKQFYEAIDSYIHYNFNQASAYTIKKEHFAIKQKNKSQNDALIYTF